jgi:hypothetical protein
MSKIKITEENYYEDKTHISNSMLKQLKKSPEHFDAYMKGLTPPMRSAALDFGSAYDEFILTPDLYKANYIVMKEKINRNSNAYKDWLLENDIFHYAKNPGGNKKELSLADYEKLNRMRDALKAKKRIWEMLEVGEKQKILTWEDNTFHVKCKGKLDNYIPGHAIVDLKTAQDCSPYGFERAVKYLWDYDQQAACYIEGVHADLLDEGKYIEFWWVVQEKEAPYIPALYEATVETLEKGAEKYFALLEQYYKLFVENKYDSKNSFIYGTI